MKYSHTQLLESKEGGFIRLIKLSECIIHNKTSWFIHDCLLLFALFKNISLMNAGTSPFDCIMSTICVQQQFEVIVIYFLLYNFNYWLCALAVYSMWNTGIFLKMFTSAHTLKMECKSNFDDLFLCKCEQLHPTAKSKHLLTGQDIIDRVHSLLPVNTRQLLAAKKLIRSNFFH